MRHKPAIWPARGAVLACVVIALGLGLGGCGRKGGLDPPPVAAAPVEPALAPPALAQPPAAPDGTAAVPAPVPAPPPPRTTWLDWLIN